MADALRPVVDVAAEVGLGADELELYGRHKAKVTRDALRLRRDAPRGKLVVVTAITPTPAGEGKTTMTLGLAQALRRLGTRVVPALREPSLGPVFGKKGGATGGGQARALPADDINLHFTGDMHAVAAANNLLAALIDNHLQHGDALRLDPRTVPWKRCLDLNDRALRHVITGLGGASDGVPHESGFEITAASEVMAILCLADDLADLKARLGRIVIGTDADRAPVTLAQLGGAGAMTALLRDAIRPNLVQTSEGGPVLIHGGPFANIAHGCSSVIATRLALALGDVCLTEAGFGADLGAEKFCDIKARQSGLTPDAAVLVATVRALAWHGDGDLTAGFANLRRHAQNLATFGLPVVVVVNRFTDDTDEQLAALLALCAAEGLPAAVCEAWARGGAGGEAAARLLLDTLATRPAAFRPLYDDALSLRKKLETIARTLYGASEVALSDDARRDLNALNRQGASRLPVCVAKTQFSFTDDPDRRNAPEGHTLHVRGLKLSAGAGFVVAYVGTLQTMPGLPADPAAFAIDCDADGTITGMG